MLEAKTRKFDHPIRDISLLEKLRPSTEVLGYFR
jgi:hypothetical protein